MALIQSKQIYFTGSNDINGGTFFNVGFPQSGSWVVNKDYLELRIQEIVAGTDRFYYLLDTPNSAEEGRILFENVGVDGNTVKDDSSFKWLHDADTLQIIGNISISSSLMPAYIASSSFGMFVKQESVTPFVWEGNTLTKKLSLLLVTEKNEEIIVSSRFI